MNPVTPLPAAGEVFLDARGSGRALRVSWHSGADVVVLSLWHGGTCSGSFRLRAEDVPDLVETLRAGLASSYDARPLSDSGTPVSHQAPASVQVE